MGSSEIRLAVVDDHSIFRDGVKRALTLEDDFKVIGEGASADDAIALCDEFHPDVMIIDLKMPGGGIKAVSEIHQRQADVGLIVVTVQDDHGSVIAALAAGARGYILKGCKAHELIDAVRVVAAGGTYVTPGLASVLLLSGNVSSGEEPKAESSCASPLRAGEAGLCPAREGPEQQGDSKRARPVGKDGEMVRVVRHEETGIRKQGPGCPFSGPD